MQVQSKCSSTSARCLDVGKSSPSEHRSVQVAFITAARLPVAAKTCVAKLCRAEERTTEGLIPGFFLGARNCFSTVTRCPVFDPAYIQPFFRCLLNPPDWQPGRPVRKVIESLY